MPRLRILCMAFAWILPCVAADNSSTPTDVGVGHASPLRTISALPLESGEWAIFANFQSVEFDPFSNADLLRSASDPGDVDSTDATYKASLVVSFGATENLTLSLNLPYVWNMNVREVQEVQDAAGGQNSQVVSLGDSDGMGDLTLLGHYRIYHNPRRQMNVSVLGGLKAPTGQTNVRTRQGNLFSTDHQPGSGAWDGLFGLAATRFARNMSLDFSAFYMRTTTGAQNTRLGDDLALNLAASYRLAERLRPSDPDEYDTLRDWWNRASWDFVLEVETRWGGKDVVDGKADTNTGGVVVALSPGFRASPGRGWDTTLSFDLPIHTDLNGTQVSPRWGLLASFGRSF